MRFQVNDIVASGPGYSKAVFVITSVEPHRPKNQYNGISLTTGKNYRLGDNGLAQKRIGVADPDWNKVTITNVSATIVTPNDDLMEDDDQTTTVDQNWFKGHHRARREVAMLQFPGNGTPEDRQRWEKLASLKSGDKFQCRVHGKLDTMTFRYVTNRGYKYVFVAENGNGTRYKYPLSVVVV